MSFEVECGSCHEQILVEQAGGIVICPHCQTALQIPAGDGNPAENNSRAADPSPQAAADSPAAEQSDQAETAAAERDGMSGESPLPAGNAEPADQPADVSGGATSGGAPAGEVRFPGLPGGEEPVSDTGLPLIHTGDSAVAALAPPPAMETSATEASNEGQEVQQQEAEETTEALTSSEEDAAAEEDVAERQESTEPQRQPAAESPPAVTLQPAETSSSAEQPEKQPDDEQTEQLTTPPPAGETPLENMGEQPGDATGGEKMAANEATTQFLPAEPLAEGGEFSFAEPAFPAVTDFPAVAESAAEQSAEKSETAATAVENVSPPPAVEAPPVIAQRGVPRRLFMMVVGYAVAVTLALIWLYLTRGRRHPLESLPDIAPKQQGYLIPEDTSLPYGHTLKLGQTGRYGSLEITPLKVTRGPATVAFVDNGDSFRTEGAVLKLWLRIRNVSAEQTVQPFGRRLHLMRGHPKGRSREAANTFVCRADDRTKEGDLILPYNLRTDLKLKGQQLERKLKPGEEYTTYIATAEEGLDRLQGKLVWRVHFRKGYNPDSGHGVTTLIDVVFDSAEIQNEST